MMKKCMNFLLACMMIFSSLSFSAYAQETSENELIINNMNTGTGLHQIEYVGGWKTSTGYPDRFLQKKI